MAIGSGLYAIATSVLLICVQIFLHSNHKWFHEYYKDELMMMVRKDREVVADVRKQLEKYNIEIYTLKIKEQENAYRLEMMVSFPENFNTVSWLEIFKNVEYIELLFTV